MSHSTTYQSRSGRPPKMMPWTVRYLHNLALRNRLGTGVINRNLCDSSDSVKDIA